MVAAAIPRKTGFSGLRRLDITRDLAGVADVIAESFRGEMDSAGERTVREMRAMGRLGLFAGWLDLFPPIGEEFSPGFVWLEDGRIVGNVTLRRASALGRGWLVGNVAVSPDYRRRGIARRLMEACIAQARDEGGAWVALEVRADNAPALDLYRSLGFQETGTIMQMHRAANTPARMQMDGQSATRIRRPHPGEESAVWTLAQSATPEGLRWAEPLRQSDFAFGWDRRLDLWLSGRGEAWWIAESEGKLVGAIEAQTFRNRREEGQLRLWVADGRCLHSVLLDAAIGSREVASRPMLIAHPATDEGAAQILEQYGFQPLRSLAHMKLDLR